MHSVTSVHAGANDQNESVFYEFAGADDQKAAVRGANLAAVMMPSESGVWARRATTCDTVKKPSANASSTMAAMLFHPTAHETTFYEHVSFSVNACDRSRAARWLPQV